MWQILSSLLGGKVRATACLTFIVISLPVITVNAACIPEGSYNPDTIECTGVDTIGVVSGNGEDTISVLNDATVSVENKELSATLTAIDTGNQDDSVINLGSVSACYITAIEPSIGISSIPQLGENKQYVWNSRLAIGVNLGNGNDYVGNHGSLMVEAILNSSVQPQVTNVTSSHQGPGPLSVEIAALGIDGGNSGDIIENTGQLTVTATDNTGANAVTAVGISSGNGKDIITNTGTITVTASSGQPAVEPQAMVSQIVTVTSNSKPQDDTQPSPKVTAIGIDAGNAKDAVVTNAGSLLVESSTDGGVPQASALGILAGNGKDTIFSDGAITVTSEVVQSDSSWTATLTGGDDLIATTTLNASATGIDSGNGGDIITNDGTILSEALADLGGLNVELNLADTSHADTSVTLNSNAIGIISGNAKDIVTNTGAIDANATSRLNSVNVEINGADAGLADSRNLLDSSATALITGSGNDTIATTGSISASAISEMLEVGVNVSYADVT
ncbi:MAG: hypothetical protein KAU29_10810, partial [Gammaproteobacteria bacterium]|nr:hypothetical protein [Gammaproteobacteria bacterium]